LLAHDVDTIESLNGEHSMIRTMTAALVITALAASTAGAQVPVKPGAVNDKLFAAAVAEDGMAELAISQVGAEKASCDELKKFSKEMIEEHNRVNQELTSLAGQKNITLPRTVDARAQFCAQSLDGVTGEHFDRCYAKAQLAAHMGALAAFEAEAERGQDADLKAFAAKTLPMIKKHMKEIKEIVNKLDDSGSSKKK